MCVPAARAAHTVMERDITGYVTVKPQPSAWQGGPCARFPLGTGIGIYKDLRNNDLQRNSL